MRAPDAPWAAGSGDSSPRPVRPRLPLRIRLTAAYAATIAIVLAATGILIFLEFSSGFDRRTDTELEERQVTIARLAHERRTPEAVVALAGEAYVQVYRDSGPVLASSRLLAQGRLLQPADIARAAQAPLVGEHPVPGTSERARVRAFAISGGRVAAIGEPLEERAEELRGLAIILGVSLPVALLLASLAGYLVARSALRPVELMRARAATLDAGERGARLPRPGTRDELDRLAVTLNDLLDRTGDALQRERRIVGNASHELRTPISVLRTRVEVALRDRLDEAGLRATLEDTRADAIRLSRLADDLLVLARADQREVPLRLEPLDVHDLLEATVARHRGADVRIGEAITGGAVVLGDPDRVAQILDNLVANALLHGSSPVRVGARIEGRDVALTVSDHGPGLPVAFIDRAFDRFSQAAPSGPARGTGLGLAIVEALARAQGGSATIENAPSGGAIATVVLPQA